MNAPRDQLNDAFERFKSVHFPDDSDSEVLSELHADLVLYDGHVAGLILRVLKGDPVDKSLLKYDEELERNISLAAQKAPEAEPDARAYLCYLRRIRELIELATSVN